MSDLYYKDGLTAGIHAIRPTSPLASGGGEAYVSEWLIKKVSGGYNLIDKDTASLIASRTKLSDLYNIDFQNQLTSGRDWEEWVRFTGNCIVDAKLLLGNYTCHNCRGAKFTLGYNGDMFGNLAGDGVKNTSIASLGGYFDGNKSVFNTAGNDCFEGILDMLRVESAFISNFTGFGIHLRSRDVNNRAGGWILNNWVGHGNATYVNGGGLWLEHDGYAITDMDIIGNFWINNGTRPFVDIGAGCLKDSRILFNHTAGNVDGAIAMYGPSFPCDLQIVANHFEYIKRNAIWFNANVNDDYVVGNVIAGNVFRDCGYEADNAYDIVHIGSNAATTAVAKGNIINDNVFRLNLQSNRAKHLVALVGTSTDGNIVNGNAGCSTRAGVANPYGTAALDDDGTNTIGDNAW